MRRDRLEGQLLAALEKRVLTPDTIEYTVRRFSEALEERLSQARKSPAGLAA